MTAWEALIYCLRFKTGKADDESADRHVKDERQQSRNRLDLKRVGHSCHKRKPIKADHGKSQAYMRYWYRGCARAFQA